MVVGYMRIDNIYQRLKDLKKLREHGTIDEFLTAFDTFMNDYTSGEFDPNVFFPNKARLNWELNDISYNLETLEILTRKNPQRSEFACNIDNIRAAVYSIQSLDWVKEITDDAET